MPKDGALILINDDIADGRDVSWLWDVDFKSFTSRKTVYCSGSRAYDMAVRLKYDDVKYESVDTSIENSIEKFVMENSSGILFLTYTSMLQARTYLKKKGATFGE